jgi:glycosyltransferase involved in cell wall biosynthesis
MGIDPCELPEGKSITQRDFRKQPPLIVTTGFLRKHKGVLTLIKAMPKVIEHFVGARLRIQCALYPSDDSRVELEKCKEEIRRLGLEESVILDTRFLEKKYLQYELTKADVAVLPYDASDEGGSATAAGCLAVGLPLIVSDAAIFDELCEVALTVPPNADHVANAIVRVLSDSKLYRDLAVRSSSFARANEWNSIVGAFLAR